ncbi:hypothetical protein [Petroclostridium sp. X23]|uniref:hypothetical protein n=1 Tax=Petroclostridium sp. X23 TaxID=3045146 RepID=UPI0024AD08F3|nr:hypothetical protein [Petroclostridium sp. X23]WHH59163.1 hypothetical protein QKW49_25815 [Petroclostridium sp. X23]
MGYITPTELANLVNSEELEGKSSDTLQIFIDAGQEMIDKYCSTQFEDPAPSIVKVVNAELVGYLLKDNTKETDTTGPLSVKNDIKAYENILNKLSGYISKEVINTSSSIRVQVI